MLDIGALSIEEYPRLSKFRKVWRIDFYNPYRSGADDEKLEIFSTLDLPHLRDVHLTACSEVTDEGIQWLSKMTFKTLDLTGTSISDTSLVLLSSHPSLEGLGLIDCNRITWKGIETIVAHGKLTQLGISLRNETQLEVLGLIRLPNQLTHLGIIDRNGVLNASEIVPIGRDRGIFVMIQRESLLERFGPRTDKDQVK
jgi:hypothetical protein